MTLTTDKEHDIELRTMKLQKELHDERNRQQSLSMEIQQLRQQLHEAKNGLLAAARINDQLELNQMTIEKLKNESKITKRQFSFVVVVVFILHFV